MGTMSAGGVLGADACPAGWVGVVLSGNRVSAVVHTEIGGLVAMAAAGGPLDAIAVDIPIGLADSGPRQADLLARKAAGPRFASVFLTPVREALLAETYAAALAVSRELTGRGISSQAYRLRAKILQVDRWRQGTLPCPVIEAHPELSFAAMAGAPLRDSKSTWAGAVRRRQLLAAHGIGLDDDLGLSGLRVGVDDVLDAAAVAWTARRVAAGDARRLPAVTERFSDGVDCAIWT
jgi:predicted RNase H-like nuclease